MSESGARKRLAESARERARAIEVVVKKYRVDPADYFTTHKVLDQEQEEADLWNALARALEEAEEENERLQRENAEFRKAYIQGYQALVRILTQLQGFGRQFGAFEEVAEKPAAPHTTEAKPEEGGKG